jgi:MFS family permease
MILPAEVLLGIGMGCVFTPAISVATTGVPARDAGVAAAMANTAMQVGGSIGTAVLNTIAVTATASYAGSHPNSAVSAALVHGYATAIAWSAGLLAAVAVVAFALIRTGGGRAARPPDTDHSKPSEQSPVAAINKREEQPS